MIPIGSKAHCYVTLRVASCVLHFYAAVVTLQLGESHLNLLNMHAHLDVHPFPARHVDRISLRSAWIESSLAAVTKYYLDPSSDRTFGCTNF